MNDDLIAALRTAVDAVPDNCGVRLQLASALLDRGESEEALLHARAVLSTKPDDIEALNLASRAAREEGDETLASGYSNIATQFNEPRALGPALSDGRDGPDELSDGTGFLIEEGSTKLDDVGGMSEVKEELERSFLKPARNPEMAERFGASVGGGLLLYGPPGCGKTLMARAVAGELGASFLALGIDDVLDMWLGQSEQRLHAAFEAARERAPSVLFLDEIDALGQKRGNLRHQAGRNVVNQLLSEMDGLRSGPADGVFVLAATNHPWDVDSALVRPGRFDQSLLVLPPDLAARERILEIHLAGRPTEHLDLGWVAKKTPGFSGADLALVCRRAVSKAMEDSLDADSVRPVTQAHLKIGLDGVKPSTKTWFDLAYNFAVFSNQSGQYDKLLNYIRELGIK